MAASPANGAASKTDIPQSSKEFAGAEKSARFRVVNSSPGVFWIDCEPRLEGGLGLTFCQSDFGYNTEFAKLNPNLAERMAHNVCTVLEALDTERRGDNGADVQRQLLDETRSLTMLLKELVAMKVGNASEISALLKDPSRIGAIIRQAIESVAGGPTAARLEPNVNDLMLEVGRAFGLSDLQTMNLDNLKGFCCAAWRMNHVPQRATKPLLQLVARGALDATPEEIERVKKALVGLGLD